MTPKEIAELVRSDVERGLGESFARFEDEAGAGWMIAAPFVDQEAITNGAFTVVPWEFRCQHTGWFQGAAPTNKPLTIRGTTIVDHRDDGNVLLHRYIDWLAVMYDLGYDLYQRQLVEVVDGETANFGRSGPPP